MFSSKPAIPLIIAFVLPTTPLYAAETESLFTTRSMSVETAGKAAWGAPPGTSERDSLDGACAQAGIAAIQETLELAE